MPNKYGKGYGPNSRVTSRTPAPLDEGGVRPSGDSRKPNSTPSVERRVTSRTGNQIPNPVEEQNQTANNIRRAKSSNDRVTSRAPGSDVGTAIRMSAQSKQVEMAKNRIAARTIPEGNTLVATKGVRNAARQRLEMSKKKGM